MSIVHTTSSSYILYDQFEIILGWILYKALIATYYKLLDFFIVIFFLIIKSHLEMSLIF